MTAHKHAGGFKKGDSIVIDGAACTVQSISVSRPGKHGHAKVRIEAVGMLDGKKRQFVAPGHDDIEIPMIGKKNAQILSVSGTTASVMDMESYESFDLEIPENLRADAVEGKTIVYWEILSDKVMKQVKS